MKTSSVALFLALSAGYLGAANAESVNVSRASSAKTAVNYLHGNDHQESERQQPKKSSAAIEDKSSRR